MVCTRQPKPRRQASLDPFAKWPIIQREAERPSGSRVPARRSSNTMTVPASPPPPDDFPTRAPSPDAVAAQLARAQAEQDVRWQHGEQVSVEGLLEQYPELARDSEAVLGQRQARNGPLT